jgi:FkbM family methyltransferase
MNQKFDVSLLSCAIFWFVRKLSNRTTLVPTLDYSVKEVLVSEFLAFSHSAFNLTKGRGEWHLLKLINRFLVDEIPIERELFHLKVRGNDPYWLRLLIKNYTYEPEINRVLQNLDLEQSAFVDIGANIGYWTHFVAANFRTKHNVLVEPNPILFEECVSSLSSNDFKVECINSAVSDLSGVSVPLFFGNGNGDHAGASLLKNPKDLKCQKVMVSTVTLDEIVRPLLETCKGVFVKLDIEGMELRVLQSCKYLTHPNLLIVYEDHGSSSECGASQYLLETGLFDLWFLHKTKRPILINSIQQLKELKISKKVGYNIFAIPVNSDIRFGI